MDLILAFALFLATMIFSLIANITLLLPMGVGLVTFSIVALRRGYGLGMIARMAATGARKSMVVVFIMLLIGCLTSLWRQCGTIAFFTDYGIRLVPPRIFILASFLLTSVMSYALGTSFGVAGTVGVILMTIARASGASPVLTGGAILSGLYVGDRASPASSSAMLTANQTGTDIRKNIRAMVPPSLLPIGLCVLFYAALSLFDSPTGVDTSLLARFEEEFDLSILCLLPTVLLIALSFAGLKIRYVMAIDIVVSMALAVFLQKISVPDMLRMTAVGYEPQDSSLAGILSGGGILSMLNVIGILIVSNGCAGIFSGTGMLSQVEALLRKTSARFGRFGAMMLTAACACAVFCNQTIGAIMCRQCMGACYGDSEAEKRAMMLDIENSVIVMAGLVPWCIACSVPVTTLGCGFGAVPFAAYLYLLPITWYIHRRREGKTSPAAEKNV